MLSLAVFALALAIVFSGFFSGAEIAFFSLSPSKVQTLVKTKRRNAALVARLKAKPERLLTTILIGNNLVNIGAASVMTYVMTAEFGSEGVGIATGIMTVLILTFGEIMPKALATRYAVRIALHSAKLLFTLQIILFPFVWFFEHVGNIPKLFLKGGGAHNVITDHDVMAMAAIGFDQGQLLDYERDIITNVLNLNDVEVQKIMTPRKKVIAVTADQTLSSVAKLMQHNRFSRVPVESADGQTYVGFIFVHDLFNYPRERWPLVTASKIMREPLYALETDKVHSVYRQLLKKNTHLVVVHDARFQVVGLVTLEDVIEEVLGEINDEGDQDHSNP